MTAYFNGQPVFGPRGPVGPDGNPVGTVIAYLGTTAPKDYLICDGSEYNISDYPDLARFLQKEFGQADWYGGDGAATFAVPDFRNLFLRGFHGDAEEQLSGEIGDKQEGTMFPYIITGYNNSGLHIGVRGVPVGNNWPESVDTTESVGTMASNIYNSTYTEPNGISTYTARPVNAAVLYCIKAVTSYPAENVFSLEEQVIGRWFDGRPVYQKTFVGTTPASNVVAVLAGVSDLSIDTVAGGNGWCDSSLEVGTVPVPYTRSDTQLVSIGVDQDKAYLNVFVYGAAFAAKQICYTLRYTKTTD